MNSFLEETFRFCEQPIFHRSYYLFIRTKMISSHYSFNGPKRWKLFGAKQALSQDEDCKCKEQLVLSFCWLYELEYYREAKSYLLKVYCVYWSWFVALKSLQLTVIVTSIWILSIKLAKTGISFLEYCHHHFPVEVWVLSFSWNISRLNFVTYSRIQNDERMIHLVIIRCRNESLLSL